MCVHCNADPKNAENDTRPDSSQLLLIATSVLSMLALTVAAVAILLALSASK